MSTWYGYVCLSHEPPVEQDRVHHGYTGREFLIWNLKRRRGDSDLSPAPDYYDSNKAADNWLNDHEACSVGVKDGYGEMVYSYPREPAKPELPPVTKATEIERGKQYLIQVDEGRPVSQEVAQRMLDKLNQRFPTNTFAIAGGCDVAEVGKASGSTRFATGGPTKASSVWSLDAGEKLIPPHEQQPKPEPHADLLDALKQAQDRLDTLRSKTPQEHKGFYGSAMVALQQLRIALLHPERDGVAPPPAATTGAATPAADESATGARTPEATPSPIRAMEIAWPLELDPDDRNGIAQQLEAIGHSSGLTYWLDVAQAIRSIRTPR